MTEMLQVAEIFKRKTPHSLVLLDELCLGTSSGDETLVDFRTSGGAQLNFLTDDASL